MAIILIVEDDTGINELMKRSLSLIGYHCLTAFTGCQAISIARNHTVDLVLLDISLPDTDGFQLKKQLPEIPVIYVTAKDEISDRVKGLNSGAEDYIIKPFHIQELIARVQVVLRRFQKEDTVYVIGAMKIDYQKHLVTYEGKRVRITNREFELLKVLIMNKNIALSRDKLLELVWGIDYEGEERTVDVHIQRLRKKLHLEEQIKTIFKFGYRLEVSN